jgi:hypothetical protein
MLAELRNQERERVLIRRRNSRKAKNKVVYHKRHLSNLTGTLIDPENPKPRYRFWKGRAPQRQDGSVINFPGLRKAIVEVYGEGHSANEYSCVSSLYLMRLKLAQHSRDLGKKMGLGYLMKASSEDFRAAGLN